MDGWDDTKLKAQERLNLLIATKAAWEGYAEGIINRTELGKYFVKTLQEARA